MKRRLVLGLAGLAMSIAFSGFQVAAGNWPEAPTDEWNALVSAAKAEGPVVIAGKPNYNEGFVQKFMSDTGLDAQFIVAARSEGRKRFEVESKANASTIDVYFGGFTSLDLAKAGLLMPIGEALILPEVTSSDAWLLGSAPFVDTEKKYLPVPALYVSGLVLLNTDLVDPATVNSWDDLLKPEFEGKIVSHDPGSPGGGQTAAAYLLRTKGADFVESLYIGNKVQFVKDYRQLTDLVARGSHYASIAALPSTIETYRSRGLDNLQIVSLPDGPGYLVGGSSVVAVPANTTHPNGAKVFVNWFLSKNGQEAYAEADNTPSMRRDVRDGPWPDYIEPVAAEDMVNIYSEKWLDGDWPTLVEELDGILK